MSTTETAIGPGNDSDQGTGGTFRTRRIDRWTYAVLAFLAYIPILLTAPGEVSADTKKNIDGLSNKEQINQYLIDPSKPAKPSLIEQLK
jgi:hypothetical protein